MAELETTILADETTRPAPAAGETPPEGETRATEEPAAAERSGATGAGEPAEETEERRRPKTIPYNRFQEVIRERNRLEAELEELRTKQQAAAGRAAPRAETPPEPPEMTPVEKLVIDAVKKHLPGVERIMAEFPVVQEYMQSLRESNVHRADAYLVSLAEAEGFGSPEAFKFLYQAMAADLLSDPERMLLVMDGDYEPIVRKFWQDFKAQFGGKGRAATRAQPAEKPRPKPPAPAAHLPKEGGTLGEVRPQGLDVAGLRKQGMKGKDLLAKIRDQAWERFSEMGKAEMP